MSLFRVIAINHSSDGIHITKLPAQRLIGVLILHSILALKLLPVLGEATELDNRVSALLHSLKTASGSAAVDIERLRTIYEVLDAASDRILPGLAAPQRRIFEYALSALDQTISHLKMPEMREAPLQSMYVHGAGVGVLAVREQTGFFPLVVLCKLARCLDARQIDSLVGRVVLKHAYTHFFSRMEADSKLGEAQLGKLAYLCMRTPIFEIFLQGKISVSAWKELDKLADSLLSGEGGFDSIIGDLKSETASLRGKVAQEWRLLEGKGGSAISLRFKQLLDCPVDRRVLEMNVRVLGQGFGPLMSPVLNSLRQLRPDIIGSLLLGGIGVERMIAPEGNASDREKLLRLMPLLGFLIYSAYQVLEDASGEGSFFSIDQTARLLLGMMVPQFVASFTGIIENVQARTGLGFQQADSLVRGMSWAVLTFLMVWGTQIYYHSDQPDDWTPGLSQIFYGMLGSFLKMGMSQFVIPWMMSWFRDTSAYSVASDKPYSWLPALEMGVMLYVAPMVFSTLVPALIQGASCVGNLFGMGMGDDLDSLWSQLETFAALCGKTIPEINSASGRKELGQIRRAYGCLSPDKGGDPELMVEANVVFDRLKAFLAALKT